MRKETRITIDDRGNELAFLIREMPAMRLESWIIRAGLALAASGAAGDLLNESRVDSASVMQAADRLAKMDVGNLLRALGGIEYQKVEPLLGELLACCSLVTGNQLQQLNQRNVDGIVQDIKTLFTLQKEALKINFGFFGNGGQSATGQATAEEAPLHASIPKISVR